MGRNKKSRKDDFLTLFITPHIKIRASSLLLHLFCVTSTTLHVRSNVFLYVLSDRNSTGLLVALARRFSRGIRFICVVPRTYIVRRPSSSTASRTERHAEKIKNIEKPPRRNGRRCRSRRRRVMGTAVYAGLRVSVRVRVFSYKIIYAIE